VERLQQEALTLLPRVIGSNEKQAEHSVATSLCSAPPTESAGALSSLPPAILRLWKATIVMEGPDLRLPDAAPTPTTTLDI
jgi:hypothetical protein